MAAYECVFGKKPSRNIVRLVKTESTTNHSSNELNSNNNNCYRVLSSPLMDHSIPTNIGQNQLMYIYTEFKTAQKYNSDRSQNQQ